jgi:hypothetical protein
VKLSWKLLVIVVPLIVAPLLILGWIANEQLNRVRSEHMLMELDIRVAQASRDIASILTTAKANVALFSKAEIVEKYLATKDEYERTTLVQRPLLEWFETLQREYPEYEEIRIILPDGREELRLVSSGAENWYRQRGRIPSLLCALTLRRADFLGDPAQFGYRQGGALRSQGNTTNTGFGKPCCYRKTASWLPGGDGKPRRHQGNCGRHAHWFFRVPNRDHARSRQPDARQRPRRPRIPAIGL